MTHHAQVTQRHLRPRPCTVRSHDYSGSDRRRSSSRLITFEEGQEVERRVLEPGMCHCQWRDQQSSVYVGDLWPSAEESDYRHVVGPLDIPRGSSSLVKNPIRRSGCGDDEPTVVKPVGCEDEHQIGLQHV